MKITVGIPTKGRYESLAHTLQSLIFQTLKPYEIIIIDDSDEPKDLRILSIYNYLFRLMEDKHIKWKVLYGQKKGQHYSHQAVQEMAETDWIFRIDDDEVAEPDVLEKLAHFATGDVGAVAPAVLMPNASFGMFQTEANTMADIGKPNVQWFKRKGQQSAEHLYSCFLYKKGIAKYDLRLSPVAHREETLFSHSIYRAGYKLIINFDAVVHHFRQEDGGIRSFKHDPSLWDHDERIFQGKLEEWGIKKDIKYIILDAGLGDHYAFKNILPELREKYDKIVIAACFPDVFHDEPGIRLISIAEAKLLFGNIDNFNIYHFMTQNNWKGSLVDAYRKLYL